MAPTVRKRLTTVFVIVALVTGVLAVGAFAASHTQEASTTQSVTYFRVIHTSPDAPMVDVYLNNESAATNASFGEATEYQTIEPGTYTLTITEAGDREAILFEENVTLDPRTPTTIAASGEVATEATSTFDARAYTDNPLKPGMNATAVRLIHHSPDGPALDVTADNGSVVIAQNVSFTHASDYVMVPSGNYTVEIREAAEGDNGTLISTTNLSLMSGEAQTMWVMGYVVPLEGQEAFAVELTRDATLSVTLPMTETPIGPDNGTPSGTATDTPIGTQTPEGTDTETATETETETATETLTP